MTIGSFILTKNEASWMRAHLECWLPHLDQMVFVDGNSTDGTLEIIRDYANYHPKGFKIKLFEGKDPKNLKEDYTRLFNEAMWSLDTDWAFFLHPDMTAENPEAAREFVRNSDGAVAASCSMRSFAGEPGGEILEIVTGRSDRWKNIYRLRTPNLGAHYHGHYGAANEDVYFSEITGTDYAHHGPRFELYPYPVIDSGLRLLHFSDVRPYERRLGRMAACLENQGYHPSVIQEVAKAHPRVTLKDGAGFKFVPWKVAA